MARHYLKVVWWILGVAVTFTASTVVVNLSPPKVEVGLTRSLIVNCTFDYSNDSTDLSSLISVTLARNDDPSNSTSSFHDLASVNTFAPDRVNILTSDSSRGSGQISSNGDSFLTLQWDLPTLQQAGLYRCSANGLDKTGQPLNVSQAALLTVPTPSIDHLLEVLRFQQLQIESLVNSLAALNVSYANDRTRLSSLEEFKTTVIRAQENETARIFKKSSHFNGRHYLLSLYSVSHVDVAEYICESHGGYLIEIDDDAEYTFLKNFVNDSSIESIVIGASDRRVEGQWEFIYSGRPVVFFSWNAQYPIERENDCVALWKNFNWTMVTYPCYILSSGSSVVCEIPDS